MWIKRSDGDYRRWGSGGSLGTFFARVNLATGMEVALNRCDMYQQQRADADLRDGLRGTGDHRGISAVNAGR
jgi:hypothetical protein